MKSNSAVSTNILKLNKRVEKLYSDDRFTLYCGDVMECMECLPQNEIQSVITSPTYWGKRSFTNDSREFGSETLEEYVDKNINLYSSLLNVMKKDGSLFIIIQDSYMGSGVSRSHHNHWENNINPSYKRVGTDSEKSSTSISYSLVFR